jgi:hypothetical protein
MIDGAGCTRVLGSSIGEQAIQPREKPALWFCGFKRRGSAGAARRGLARPRRQILVGRRVTELWHQVEAAALGDQARGRRVRIGEIAEVTRARGARPHARRNSVLLGQIGVVDSVDTERALLHHALIGVQLARTVRARPGAQAAADAERLVDQHDAVLGALV